MDRIARSRAGFLGRPALVCGLLIHFYAAVSPKGSAVHVSVWDSDEHAAQLDRLKEMAVDARVEAEAVGVTFTPIVNYPINWTI